MPPKKTRCGTCSGCTAEQFCGKCRTCSNMVRFNGTGTLKKPCLLRVCISPLVAQPPPSLVPVITQPSGHPAQSEAALESPSSLVPTQSSDDPVNLALGAQEQEQRSQEMSCNSEPPITSSELPTFSPQPSTSAGLVQDVAPLLDMNILGFAKSRTCSFLPARKIGEVGRAGLVRVKWFATGKVGVVSKDCWTTYSEQKVLRFSRDRGVNKVQFAKAVEEMLAMLDKLERDGEVEPDSVDQLHSDSLVISKKQPAAARKLEKFSRISYEHSETLTAAAKAEFIVSGVENMLYCKVCRGVYYFVERSFL